MLGNLEEVHKWRFLKQANLIGGVVWILWGGIVSFFHPDLKDSVIHRLPGGLPPLFAVMLVSWSPWAKRHFEILLSAPITLLTLNAIYIQYANGFPPAIATAIPALFGLSIYGFFDRRYLAAHTLISVCALLAAIQLHGWSDSLIIHFLNSITLLGIGFLFVSHRLRILESAEQSAKSLADETLKNNELVLKASQVAHDIRSPIMALRTLRDVLPIPEEAKKVLNTSIQRVEGVAEDLLDELRVQKQPLQPITGHQIARLAEELLAEKHVRTSKLGVMTKVDPELASMRTVFLSEIRLKRTLGNLIDNAIDAIEARSSSEGRLLVKVSENLDSFIIEVVDSGIGVTPEVLPLLTEKGASFGKERGNGLGLWAARMFAEGHGGSLKIASEVGLGTTVSLRLPVASGG